jgi:hypothetical protein
LVLIGRPEESERVAAFYARQEAEREARNAREAAAAQEYEVAERNRRAGMMITLAMPARRPHLAKADIRALEGYAGFDPLLPSAG